MSEEKVELVRPLLAEWAEGNFWGGGELMAPDVTFRAAPPANFVAHGREEAARQMLDLLAHWSDYRIEAEELEDLGEDSVLVVGRQRGTGKLSGAEVDYPIFIVWKFRGNEVIGVYLEGTRDSPLRTLPSPPFPASPVAMAAGSWGGMTFSKPLDCRSSSGG